MLNFLKPWWWRNEGDPLPVAPEPSNLKKMLEAFKPPRQVTGQLEEDRVFNLPLKELLKFKVVCGTSLGAFAAKELKHVYRDHYSIEFVGSCVENDYVTLVWSFIGLLNERGELIQFKDTGEKVHVLFDDVMCPTSKVFRSH